MYPFNKSILLDKKDLFRIFRIIMPKGSIVVEIKKGFFRKRYTIEIEFIPAVTFTDEELNEVFRTISNNAPESI